MDHRLNILKAIELKHGRIESITRPDLQSICTLQNITYPQWLTTAKIYRKERGVYTLPWNLLDDINSETEEQKKAMEETNQNANIQDIEEEDNVALTTQNLNVGNKQNVLPPLEILEHLIPPPVDNYTPFGCHTDVKKIIHSGKWYPTLITGPSGNGKTSTIQQVCHQERREWFRVNVTVETDEDDLLGGFRLVDGQTKFNYGPMVQAMQRGAIVVLDEVDLASPKIMCIQPILEGKAIFLKKTGEWIHPRPGFNVFATANTKGKGSDDGRFVGTGVMNEAFLDRFSATIEQDYPPEKTERTILTAKLAASGITDDHFVECLVRWARSTRESFSQGSVDELISTRRLLHAAEAFIIFKDKMKAIQMSLARFDITTKTSFVDLYKSIDASVTSARNPKPGATKPSTTPTGNKNDKLPF